MRFSSCLSLLHWVTRSDVTQTVRWTRVWVANLTLILSSGFLSFLLRFDFFIPSIESSHLIAGLLVWLIVKSLTFHYLGLDRGWWRYVSVFDLSHIAFANLLGSAISAAVIYGLGPTGFPRSIYVIDLMVCFLLTCGARIAVRLLYETVRSRKRADSRPPVLIYGAGLGGTLLLREIRTNPSLKYEPSGFVDDDPNKLGVSIQGLKVLGSGRDLNVIGKRLRIQEILIAVPSATGSQMSQILQYCKSAGLTCRTLPSVGEMLSKGKLKPMVREVAVEDLLCRAPIHIDSFLVQGKFEGKVVLVTGAAGSIGSELCHQVARFRPKLIVGYEIAETALFHLERNLRAAFPDVNFVPFIGNIQNRRRLEEAFSRFCPQILFHAAAYKHVPLMESHLFEAVENNVFGTAELAQTVADCGIEDFVLISSDKAVRPTNVMGATKRAAELVVLATRARTKFVAVRFGNVLGSNGSVVPLFKQQIAAGGPVTVTHPAMERFFMTIPEAAQLVLQAAAMGRGGEIFVLDMGEPVRIIDLARSLISLSGLDPDKDIHIEFTGMRPGEKLSEEVSRANENTRPTYHDKVRIFSGPNLRSEETSHLLSRLQAACNRRDAAQVIEVLRSMVPDYTPSENLLGTAEFQEKATSRLDTLGRALVVPLRFASAGGGDLPHAPTQPVSASVRNWRKPL